MKVDLREATLGKTRPVATPERKLYSKYFLKKIRTLEFDLFLKKFF